MISIGLEVLLQSHPSSLQGKRLGLLTNQASVNRGLIHNRILLQKYYGENLTTLFSPQHGFYSEKQDNMIESDHMKDDLTGLPVFSLYGDLRKPNEKMLDNVDVLLIDLMDVGTRVYTFLYTMGYCLEAAAEYGKKVVVLDRPNPIDGISVEGNLLSEESKSFVGLYPIPMRHGLTFAELALFINEVCDIQADLEVIPMQGWLRGMRYSDTGLPWVFPSPNMPTTDTASVYPGQVIWEGTNISEGRGTTLPFELFGSPFIEHTAVIEEIRDIDLPGCFIRPLLFQPTSGKWADEVCNGFQIHVVDSSKFMPYRTSLVFMQAFLKLYPEHFKYKQPPYEYDYKKLPMDLILGSQKIRQEVEKGIPVLEIESHWFEELDEFKKIRRQFFLYK